MPPNLAEPSDAELLQRTKQGDANAYGELYDRYFEQIYRYVQFRVGLREEAEDLAEAVFLRTWEAIARSNSTVDNFQGWLFRSAHNAIIDHYRTRKNMVSLDQVAQLTDPTPVPESVVQQRLDGDKLNKALAKLPADLQQLIACRFGAGLSHAETAAVMGLKEGHLRVMQFRALKQLRKLLTED